MQKAVESGLVGPSSKLGGMSLLLLAVIISADAVCRSAGIALVGASEVSGVLLACLIFLSIGQTQQNRGHVAIEAIVSYMPPAVRRIAEFIALTACFILCIVITYGVTLETISSYQKMEYQYGTVPFPLWPVKVTVAFGFFVLVLQQAVQLVHEFGVITGRLAVVNEVRIPESSV
jgi:TRAP-type C4-dicarboxylate transport system permease small subunit